MIIARRAPSHLTISCWERGFRSSAVGVNYWYSKNTNWSQYWFYSFGFFK